MCPDKEVRLAKAIDHFAVWQFAWVPVNFHANGWERDHLMSKLAMFDNCRSV